MIVILFIIACSLVLGYAAWQYYMVPELGKAKKPSKDMVPLYILLAVGLVARIICACAYKGHNTDMACFTSWARSVFEGGVGNFYSSAGFTDYPPGYMYILYIVGAIRQLFSLDGTGYYLLVKLPAIIADLVSSWLIYKIASKKLSTGISALLAALYLFNPAVITDSSLWGQVDSVYTLALALMVWLIAEKKLEISYFVFAICILIKPQAFIYTPLIIFGIIENYVYPEFKSKELLKSIGIGLCAIAFMALLAVPFNFKLVVEQYVTALSEYPYFTINALNLWGVFGYNWHQLSTAGTVIGYIILALIVVASAYVFFKSKSNSKYYFVAAILAFFTFMLSTKMHERYGFPVMIFLLLALIETRNIYNYALYILVSLSQFYNIAWVLFIYETEPNKYAFYPGFKIASVINVLVLAYMVFVTYKMYVKNGIDAAMITTQPVAEKSRQTEAKVSNAKSKAKPKGTQKPSKTGFTFRRTEQLVNITRKELAIIAAIMVIYSAFALYELGDMSAPETGVQIPQSAASINLGEAKSISSVRVFVGETPVTAENPMLISFRTDESAQDERVQIITEASAMQWLDIGGLSENAQFVTLSSAGSSDLIINEVDILSGGESLTPLNRNDERVSALFDEEGSATPTSGKTLIAPVDVTLNGDTEISKMNFFIGPREFNSSDRRFNVVATDSVGRIVYSQSISGGSVFRWEQADMNVIADKIILSTPADELYINEVEFKDNEGKHIVPASVTGYGSDVLFDEQELAPERYSFRNGTYFDEIYHARTAYEHLHHMPVYEWTHPPLGKIIISIGIMIFGMNPFGWRIMGTLFGIFMIPIIYIFAKKLVKKPWLAIVTCLLFTFDFMHFAQTRIATIDVYVTFFIMLMYLFMFKYYSMSFNDTPVKKTLVPLALCGTMMGLGIASKWTGMYAGAGLAVIFFTVMYRRWREYKYALERPNGETDGITHKDVIDNYRNNMLITLAWCVIFFIIVPAIIYALSYIPYLLVPGDDRGLRIIIDNQRSMLSYHANLESTHPYSSKWYEWIIMKRPIWYYSGTISDGVKEGISSFGNPLVWWMGIPAFFWIIYNAFSKRDKTCVFLIIAYLAQLVPWILVPRLTFIYHYFPCVPFIALMIGYSIKLLYDYAQEKNKKAIMYGTFVYTGLVIVLFIMFYPVLTGMPCSVWYAQHFLKWFDTWVLL